MRRAIGALVAVVVSVTSLALVASSCGPGSTPCLGEASDCSKCSPSIPCCHGTCDPVSLTCLFPFGSGTGGSGTGGGINLGGSANGGPGPGFCACGQMACGDTCADMETDANNCGACGTVCSGTTNNCVMGQCVCGHALSDPEDVTGLLCEGVCYDSTDPNHCGNCNTQCPKGATCVFNDPPGSAPDTWTCVCPTGTTQCGDACVNTMTDPNNCGVCGQACAGGGCCVGGACIANGQSCGFSEPCSTIANMDSTACCAGTDSNPNDCQPSTCTNGTCNCSCNTTLACLNHPEEGSGCPMK